MDMNEATRAYIREHGDDDVRRLALQAARQPDVDMTLALQQIRGRQTARKKMPTWAACEDIVYPPHLSMEQCSSELTARYKAAIVAEKARHLKDEGVGSTRFVDLTGGFGVDFSWMSRSFDERIYVERNADLCALASTNFPLLGLKATVVQADACDYLHGMEAADVVFLDPARRNEQGGRTYALADCTPNVLEMVDEWRQKVRFVVLKLSPMLDWHKAVDDLTHDGESSLRVEEVHLVAVQNECKELLVVLATRGGEVPVRCVCVNLNAAAGVAAQTSDNVEVTGGSERFEFDVCEAKNARFIEISLDGSDLSAAALQRAGASYLYEPHAAIMKAGCFALLCQRLQLATIAKDSHLFVADRLVDDFPGRQFRIVAITTMNKRELATKMKGIDKANITVRNFPMGVAQLRKRLKLKDGGDDYLFATTLADGSHVLIIAKKAG